MKRVEELGISPAPWESHNQFVIANDDGSVVSATNMRDARLIAAAPELYEALREAVIEVCHNFTCCGSSDDGYSCNGERECFVAKWRAVLAKAGGEKKGDAE